MAQSTIYFSPQDAKSKIERYQNLKARLWTNRSSFDSHWRDLADFMAPRRTRFFAGDKNRGDKRNQKIINSTALFALRTLSSGLHSGLTSPARPWFKLTTPDPDLRDVPAVKQWLHTTTQRMATVFLQSNLYNSLPIVYGDMGGFGTAAMAMLEDDQEVMRTYTYPIGSYAVGSDARGIVSTFVRELEMTVEQVIERYAVRDDNTIDWSVVSQNVKRSWVKGDTQDTVKVCWVVTPNRDYDPNLIGPKFFKFASCHFEQGETQTVLRESGYKSFPIMVPRWDITGEDDYGTSCPAMIALGDVMGLQIQEKKKAQAISKYIDPSLVGPYSLRNQKTSLLAGDITYQDVREGQQGLRPIHEMAINLNDLRVDMRDVEYRIKTAFYEPLFLMLAQADASRGAANITAREVEERHEEKLLALGPVLERTNDELLDPLIDRCYQIMEDGDLIPEPPHELDGVKLKVEYLSIMASAQKLVGVVGQDRFLQTVVPLAELFPEVTDKVDVMQLLDIYSDQLGLDPRIVKPTDVARAAVAARQKAQQQMQEAQQGALMAKTARDAAQAPMTGDTALTRLVQGVSGEALQQPQ